MPHITTTDGTSLFYKDWGSASASPVVFIHGWPLNADMWEYQMTPLARQGLRTIAYDRRGFGRSDQPLGPYDYDVFADDLKAVLDGLDLRNVTLVGFSMGGGEIARYLSRHAAARVVKVALVSTVVPFLLKTPDHPEGVDRGVFDQMVGSLEDDRPQFLTDFGKLFFGAGLLGSPVSAGIMQWTLYMALQASPVATIDCVRAFSETDFRGDLPFFKVPTLIIHGTGDKTVPAGITGDAAAAALPEATHLHYANAPHGLFITDKDRLTEDLSRFIRS
nr:alpha/beta hydrolase [uncultured Lichenicoccus sp.]